jgi:hypothetical protein
MVVVYQHKMRVFKGVQLTLSTTWQSAQAGLKTADRDLQSRVETG